MDINSVCSGKMEALNCEALIEMLESNQLAAADADVELRYALLEQDGITLALSLES